MGNMSSTMPDTNHVSVKAKKPFSIMKATDDEQGVAGSRDILGNPNSGGSDLNSMYDLHGKMKNSAIEDSLSKSRN